MKVYINKTTLERRTELNLKMMGLPVDDINTLNAYDWYEYVSDYPVYNKVTQYLERAGNPVLRNNQYVQSYNVVDIDPMLCAELETEGFKTLREERNKRLAETDYLVLDYPLTSEQLQQVKIYRQALRDLPNREGAPFLESIPWPEKPDFIK